ncbi:putative toxin-antitoxin system, toxin component [Leptospira interrogans serovar Grippotyphosa str. LT2186]|uniref:Putative toxin-antitoxin system, toxin component n=1 Tax=Leptospira interrogans serovar Grippotyphosa str. LT2186 TaxID=1001599 RepID=M3I8A8_LEPIR|nr:putative toxin-antitoxin system, toxin component [Leptospira interrogans serovar Grippotyphosa str. LT2186]
MTAQIYPQLDPKLDLVLERIIDVPRELVWKVWTTPEHLKPWFCPSPWKTIDCEIDLRPGGIFRTTMQSPEGENFPNLGCYLEIIPNERLVWTDALQPGFRPSPDPNHPFGFLLQLLRWKLMEPEQNIERLRFMEMKPTVKNTKTWVFMKAGESL